MAARKIIVNQKQYTMPKISTPAYLDFLDTQEKLEDRRTFRRADLMLMIDAIIKIYGNQFTRENVLDEQYGLAPAAIMIEYTMIEKSVLDDVDKQVEKMQKNFTSGNQSPTLNLPVAAPATQ